MAMIGGTNENEPEDRPPARPTTTPPSSPSPPIAPPSPPLHGAGLGRRLFGSIRALLPARSPATAAPKLGLGLLLHLRSDHPLLHPIPSPSPSASEEDPLELGEGAVAAAGLHMSTNGRYGLNDGAATSAPASTTFSRRALHLPEAAADAGGELQEEKLVGDKKKVVKQRGASHRPRSQPITLRDMILSKESNTTSTLEKT